MKTSLETTGCGIQRKSCSDCLASQHCMINKFEKYLKLELLDETEKELIFRYYDFLYLFEKENKPLCGFAIYSNVSTLLRTDWNTMVPMLSDILFNDPCYLNSAYYTRAANCKDNIAKHLLYLISYYLAHPTVANFIIRNGPNSFQDLTFSEMIISAKEDIQKDYDKLCVIENLRTKK